MSLQLDLVETFRAQLRRRLGEAPMSMRQLSDAAGMNESVVKKILSGASRDPQLGTVAALASALGCSPLALLRDDAGDVDTVGDLTRLPVYDLRLSAGPGAWCEDDGEPVAFQPFSHSWLRSVTRAPVTKLMIVRVDGDSMEPQLHHGDHIMIDTTATQPSRDGIYALRHDDALLVKRLSVNPANGTLTVSSDNPRYKTWEDIPSDHLTIIGRVVWTGRCV